MEKVYEILFFLASGSSVWTDNWGILIGEGLCGYVSLLTLVFAILLCLIFYVVINRLTASFQKTSHWFIFALLSGVIGFIVAFANVSSGIYKGIEIQKFGYMFAISNIIWPIIYFVLFSFIFKNFSLFAKRTPI